MTRSCASRCGAPRAFAVRAIACCAVVTAALGPKLATAAGRVVRVDHPDLEAVPCRGPAAAPVVIEVFFSPTQNPQRSAYKAVEALQALHRNRIRLEYRIIKAVGSSRLHYAALEAHTEGKFDAFIAAIRRTTAALTTAQLLELARGIGMDPLRLAAVLSNPPKAYDRMLDENFRRLREKARPAMTPFVLINGHALRATSTSSGELEIEYRAALDQARELIDRGADPRHLTEAFDAQAARNPLDIVVPTGTVDSISDEAPRAPPLASPALSLEGLPSLGPSGAAATIAVLCDPTSVHCAEAIRAARAAQDVFADAVRLVWAPYFDLDRDGATPAAALADALLCTDTIAPGPEAFSSSASRGWRRVEATLSALNQRSPESPAAMTDSLATGPNVDPQAFAACRSRRAGAAVTWIKRARRAGVRVSPSTVIGGRIYPGITDARALQQLIDAELHPGRCYRCLGLAEFAPTWRR